MHQHTKNSAREKTDRFNGIYSADNVESGGEKPGSIERAFFFAFHSAYFDNNKHRKTIKNISPMRHGAPPIEWVKNVREIGLAEWNLFFCSSRFVLITVAELDAWMMWAVREAAKSDIEFSAELQPHKGNTRRSLCNIAQVCENLYLLAHCKTNEIIMSLLFWGASTISVCRSDAFPFYRSRSPPLSAAEMMDFIASRWWNNEICASFTSLGSKTALLWDEP